MASGGDFLSSTLQGGRDFVLDYVCTLCQKEDTIREAVGWCRDCEDYLCQECYRNHLKPRPSSDHTLLDKTSMPKHPSCNACQFDGKDKDAAGYCNTCDDYLCDECFKIHNKPMPMRHHELLDQTRMPHKKQNRDDNRTRTPGLAVTAPSHKTPTSRKQMSPLPARATRATRGDRQQQQGETMRSRADHVTDITLPGQHENTPSISGGVVMPASRLVLVDNNTSTIIMLGLAGSTAQTRLALTSRPWDITLVNSSLLAVTCPDDHKLLFLKVGDKLQLDREVNVKGECFGIACINDRLVVSYNDPVKVELLSMSGKVLQTVVTEDQGKHLFTWPWYVEVSRDLATIYISDWNRSTVTRLSLAGQVLATYQDTNLVDRPRGLAVDKAGSVYVCGYGTDNVVQLAADLTQSRQLLQESDGVKCPWSVCYCQATEKLVIGNESDVIKVLQLK